MTTMPAGVSRLKYLGYARVYDVILAVKKYDDINEAARFGSIMFDIRIDPNSLSEILKTGVKVGVFVKAPTGGYVLTDTGRELIEHARAIMGL